MESQGAVSPSAGVSFSSANVDITVTLLPASSGATRGIYFTGDTLSANVCLNVKFPLKCLRVVFKVQGIVKLGNVTKKICVAKRTILGSDVSKKLMKLEVKPHNLSVSVDIPESSLPSASCNSHFVRYYCQAKIIRRLAMNTIRSGSQELNIYQDNANYQSSISEQQDPIEESKEYKKLLITYQLTKSGFYLGETPTIVGEIYNAGKSAVKLRMGMDIHQVTTINGVVHLLVTQIKTNQSKKAEQFAKWSGELTIAPMQRETFSGEVALKDLPPTTNCERIDITYTVVLKVVIEKSLPFLKPKKLELDHPIVIARHPDRRHPMPRSASRISIGKHSIKRKPSTPRIVADSIFSPDDSPPPSFHLWDTPSPITDTATRHQRAHNSSAPPTYQRAHNSRAPPAYHKC